jgi:hypothetical protein
MSEPKRDSKKQISEICLVIYVALFLSAGCILGVPGDYHGLFYIMGLVACVPIFTGPVQYRIIGVVAVLFALLLARGDIVSGKKHQEKMHQIMTVTNTQP